MEIDKKLKDMREKAAFTQEQVAEAVMVSRQTVSNWETGKSLPDIVSIIKLSDLYNISIDELLKGDQKMQIKIEKDAKLAQANKKVVLVTAVVTLISLAIYFVSVFVGGSFLDFCEHAIRWVLVGIAITFAIMYLHNLNRNSKRVFYIGALQMKKLQGISVVLLLFGIWLSIFPMGESSNIPELVSFTSVISGLICGAISLLGRDK
ncbi:MAG: helix-turn-helix transcriptional regulator [Ruminococcaceae bacterium]|nr:helix-turn-helix transcriptional regulator [Oscillospiraceae bacterium]